MHVEVADDLGSNQTIRVYYGKSGATTNSNIETTFLLGDDFPGSTIDTGKWNVTGTVAVADSKVTLNQDDDITSIETFGFGTAVTSKVTANEQDSSFVGYKYDDGDRTQLQNSDAAGVDNFNRISLVSYKNDSWENFQNNTWNTWQNIYHQYTIKRISSSLLKYSQDTNSNTYTNSSYISTLNMGVNMYVWDSSQASTLICEWIFVRKCNDPEPAFASAGAEQNPPIDGNSYWYYNLLKRRN